jgi:hypothetical protein
MESPLPVRRPRRGRSSSLLGSEIASQAAHHHHHHHPWKPRVITDTLGIDDYQLKSAFLNLTVLLLGGLVHYL